MPCFQCIHGCILLNPVHVWCDRELSPPTSATGHFSTVVQRSTVRICFPSPASKDRWRWNCLFVCLFYLPLSKKKERKTSYCTCGKVSRATLNLQQHPSQRSPCTSLGTRQLPSCHLCRFLWCSSAICRAAPVIAFSSCPQRRPQRPPGPLALLFLLFIFLLLLLCHADAPHYSVNQPAFKLFVILFVCLCHSVGNKASIAEAVYV